MAANAFYVLLGRQLIVIHDKTLERTTNGIGFIKNKTQAELASLDACHTLFPQWPDNDGVPSLADVLTLLKDFDHLQLEVKTESAEDCMIVAEQLPALWQAFGSRAVTTSFNIDYSLNATNTATDSAWFVSRRILSGSR